MTVYCQRCPYEADGLLDYENHTRWAHDPLTFDEAEALGLDGTGRDGNPRFPYTLATLTPYQRSRLWTMRAAGFYYGCPTGGGIFLDRAAAAEHRAEHRC